jgi:nucleotide-binding universal stress UspA family protein
VCSAVPRASTRRRLRQSRRTGVGDGRSRGAQWSRTLSRDRAISDFRLRNTWRGTLIARTVLTEATQREAPPAGKRVLVLFEAGRAGTAAVDLGRELAEHERAALTVASIVPQAPSGSRCGGTALEYNVMLQDTVASELQQARARLGEAGVRARFELLIEGSDPPLADWVARSGFDLVLLPARRRPLRPLGHPAASRLRRRTLAEVRIVAAP